MSDYKIDRVFSERFVPDACEIISQNMSRTLIRPATFREDWHQATDLVVLRADGMDFGLRVRRHLTRSGEVSADKYGDEFTIRGLRTSGAKTELTKVIDGWGDYFLYGFAAAPDPRSGIGKYGIYSYRGIVAMCARCPMLLHDWKHNGGLSGFRMNPDGESGFWWFNVPKIKRWFSENGKPLDFVVAEGCYREPHTGLIAAA